MAGEKEKVKLTRWQKIDRQCRDFANFFYNKQTGEVMARSRSSWGKIGLFYLIYYGFLVAFFSVCLTVFLTTLNEPGKGGPKTTQFLVGKSAPGFDSSKHGSVCVPGNKPRASADEKPCAFNRTSLGPCSGLGANGDYGVDDSSICAFVKINKVYGWVPNSEGKDYLKLDCASDKGSIQVIPEGYLVSAFPFYGEDFYQTPPLAIKVNSTEETIISCELKGKGFTVSESHIAARAFGKIRFHVRP
eukprot:gene11269-12449_t